MGGIEKCGDYLQKCRSRTVALTRRCWEGCEISWLGGWSQVDSVNVSYDRVKPWGTATRTSGMVSGSGKADGRDALLAGQPLSLLNRLCKGYSFAVRCKYAADISNQMRLSVNPGSPTL